MDYKEIVFKIEVSRYEAFKELCREKGTIPAVELKRFVKNYVEQKREGAAIAYKLLWMNLCNGNSRNNLEGNLTQEVRNNEFINVIQKERPHAVVFHEFAPAYCDDLVQKLQEEGFEFFYPEGYVRPREGKKTAVAALAVANGCKFEQVFLDDIELSYRYISGNLREEGGLDVFLMLPHIPSAGGGTNEVALKRKNNMLKRILRHSIKRESENLLSVGGYNSIIKDAIKTEDDVYFGEFIKHHIDTSVKKNPTVKDQRLDYCFANSSANSKYSISTDEVEMPKTVSDHSYLRIEIKERK